MSLNFRKMSPTSCRDVSYISHTATRPIRPSSRLFRYTSASRGYNDGSCRKTLLIYILLKEKKKNISNSEIVINEPESSFITWTTERSIEIDPQFSPTHHSSARPSRLRSRRSHHIPRTWVYSVRFYISSETLHTLRRHRNMLVRLSVPADFLSEALSSKPIGSYWWQKSSSQIFTFI